MQEYDGFAIQIEHQHATIQTQGESAALCLYRDFKPGDVQSPGMQCMLAIAQNGRYADTYRSYWFPASQVSSIVYKCETASLDLTDSQYDAYIMNDISILEGLQYWTITRTGANSFQANKFQMMNTTAWNYNVNEDLRYEKGDRVDLWTLFKNSTGHIIMEDAMNRTLDARDVVVGLATLVGLSLLAVV